jgi:hypothetical protein
MENENENENENEEYSGGILACLLAYLLEWDGNEDDEPLSVLVCACCLFVVNKHQLRFRRRLPDSIFVFRIMEVKSSSKKSHVALILS